MMRPDTVANIAPCCHSRDIIDWLLSAVAMVDEERSLFARQPDLLGPHGLVHYLMLYCRCTSVEQLRQLLKDRVC